MGRVTTLKPRLASQSAKIKAATLSDTRKRGSSWMAQRERIQRRDCGLCQECKRQGKLTHCQQSDPIDHIVPRERGGSDEDSNLQLLCWHCHDVKSRRERAGG